MEQNLMRHKVDMSHRECCQTKVKALWDWKPCKVKLPQISKNVK